MDRCLTDEDLSLYLEGELAPAERAVLREHTQRCQPCFALLLQAARAQAAPGGEPLAATAAAAGAGSAAAWCPPTAFDGFRLIDRLGEGTMGQVWLGQDTQLDRRVAVKFIQPGRLTEDARRRFLDEGRAIARLNHPNIVAVYRTGEVDGRPYLVSEFVPGKSLDQEPRPMPWRAVLRVAVELARGLAAAHRSGVLHRDIKPANILLTPEHGVKLVDFGLAKLLEARPEAAAEPADAGLGSGAPRPDTGVVGTPLYMAPEAWDSEPPRAAADVYSLGVVLYELCAGSLPHRAMSLAALRHLVRSTDAPPLSEAAPPVPGPLAAVIEGCLRRAAAERYASGVELCQALEAVAARLEVPAWRRAVVPVGAALLLLSGAPIGLVLRPWLERRRLPRPGAMVLLTGGTFRMGSTPLEIAAARDWCRAQPGDDCPPAVFEREQPVRQVRVSPYRIDATEVTNADYAGWLNRQPGLRVDMDREFHTPRYVRAGEVLWLDVYPSFKNSQGLAYEGGRFVVLPGFERKPVTHVSWDGALGYCQGQGKRLPTEAEWEYAARGDRVTRFPWGGEDPRCEGVVFAREKGQSCAHLGLGTAAVGSSAQDRTPSGVYDLGGNVGEWVMDRFEERYRPCEGTCQDPVVSGGPGGVRVVRGGDWRLTAVDCRAAARSRWPQGEATIDIGFRCAAPVER